LQEIQQMKSPCMTPPPQYEELIRMSINSLKLTKAHRKHWEEVVEQLWHENRNLYEDLTLLVEFVSSHSKQGKLFLPDHVKKILEKNYKKSYHQAYGIDVEAELEKTNEHIRGSEMS